MVLHDPSEHVALRLGLLPRMLYMYPLSLLHCVQLSLPFHFNMFHPVLTVHVVLDLLGMRRGLRGSGRYPQAVAGRPQELCGELRQGSRSWM